VDQNREVIGCLRGLTGAAFRFAAKSNKRNSNYQFWQVNNHPEEIFSEPFLSKINRAAFRYIHMNPVRAGIVSKASEYIYSSASNYVEKESILDIIVPSIPILNPLAKNGYDIDIGLW
jgi:hypothetical protein